MTLIEAIKSGRPFRRTSYSHRGSLGAWLEIRKVPRGDTVLWIEQDQSEGAFSVDDVLANDWEIQEPTVTITRTQFWKAVESVRASGANMYGYPQPEALACMLGLEAP